MLYYTAGTPTGGGRRTPAGGGRADTPAGAMLQGGINHACAMGEGGHSTEGAPSGRP
jgi:hypothetical protein